jgi:ribosomal protein L40E
VIKHSSPGTVVIENTSDPAGVTNGSLGIFVDITTTIPQWSWAKISVNYSDTDVPERMAKSGIQLYYWTGTEWAVCENGGSDPGLNLVWANVTHLTIFAPIGVLPENHAPELLDGKVSPASGNVDDLFTYTVTYKDIDGDMPSFVVVIIDESDPRPMTALDPSDLDVTNGKSYILANVKLSASKRHTYRFAASDGLADAVIGTETFTGPTVAGVPPGPGEIGGADARGILYALGDIAGIPILPLIIVAVVVILVVILVLRIRAKRRELEAEAREEVAYRARIKMCPTCGATLDIKATRCDRCGRVVVRRRRRIQCPHCREVNDATATICRSCGKRLKVDVEAKVTCSSCGAKNDPTNTECIECGSKLVPSAPVLPPPSPPAARRPRKPEEPPSAREPEVEEWKPIEEEELMKELEEFTWEEEPSSPSKRDTK